MEKTCLGVVAAMPQEIAPLLRRMKGYRKERAAGFNLYRFELEGTCVALVESGMGAAHARSATEALISLARPGAILNFGLCGGVLPGLALGELVLAERVCWLAQGRLTLEAQPDPELSRLVLEGCASAGVQVQRGSFITAAAIMNKKEVALSLGDGAANPVLEMETAAVLRAAGERGIPALALRGVSDPWDEELAFSLEEFCDSELRISPARVVGCIARRPWIIPQLIRLSGNSKKAGEKLALGVETALRALARHPIPTPPLPLKGREVLAD
jgi:adenosylhomocysteine nucleosidase